MYDKIPYPIKKDGAAMKKSLIPALCAVTLCVCMLARAVLPASAAAMVCFTAVNDTLLPLEDRSMPAAYDGMTFVPVTIFRYMDMYTGFDAESNRYYVYKGVLRLNIHLNNNSTITDADGNDYPGYRARSIGGLLYLPLELLCYYFGLTYTIIPNSPLNLLRIKSPDTVFNDVSFVGLNKSDMQTYYNEYMESKNPTPPTDASAPPPPTETENYRDSTIYISILGADSEYTKQILDLLARHGVYACFYLTQNEIRQNPALVREIAGRGHIIGLSLESPEEYGAAAELLFDAAKLVTPIVTSIGENAELRGALSERGLAYRQPAHVYQSSESEYKLPSKHNSRAELCVASSAKSARILGALISAADAGQYSVAPIFETTPEAK
jgi:hypothetical protein